MASAVLASPNEPFWRENNKANSLYMKRYPSTAASSSSDNPLFNFTNPNPKLSPNFGHRFDNLSSAQAGTDADLAEFGYGGYTTVNLAERSRSELRELRKRLVGELGQIQNLRNWVESEYPTVRTEKGKEKKSSKLKKGNGWGPKRGNQFSGSGKDYPKPDQQPPGMEKVVGSIMRRCGQILSKLMKHKFGWVFNTPVDVKAMGLHDYYQVVKQPMDLGTVKEKLEEGVYGSPLDFADDVRLTFNNALRYNPEGQDVHFMAGQMLKLFEDMFNPAYIKFEDERRKLLGSSEEMSMPSKKRRVLDHTPMESVRRGPVGGRTDNVAIAKKSETVKGQSALLNLAPAPSSAPVPAPAPAPAPSLSPQVVSKMVVASRKLPKPKARDPNKRDMTMEEKARLGLNLQDLPEEKMVQLLSIIRKRNHHLANDGDEIELDIEAVDTETLWELDRFVCNYKKMASKIRRQGLIHNQISPGQLNKSPVSEVLEATTQKGRKGDAGEEDVDIGEDIPMNNFPPVEIEKDATGCATSSSSSSSSSSSDSSSSDSESGSSSGSDSDADSVQSPFVESGGNGA